ncbi:hypothetical protein POTOM_052343 [Populus tomentosa]|uniref:Pentatricopeptide repeat-containing protein n=1 Tax=Populus tomentosa TaxID=118781 RepID=A0A8X7Y7M6_POPTO|nr:hypothetical protein POTOM_052343 [Populus tomentosa]
METKSITTWNSMLYAYTSMDRSEEASFQFQEMLFSGIEPNYVTIASILRLCARVPENPVYYVLIANMHAAACRWSKLAEVRTSTRDLVADLMKAAGYVAGENLSSEDRSIEGNRMLQHVKYCFEVGLSLSAPEP